MQFFSQCGQDQFLFEHFFRGKRDGVFVDIGAYDGQKFSNSLFFERSLGWRGLCVEPLPSAFAKLAVSRKAICEQVCVADFEGVADFLECDAGIDEKMLSGMTSLFDPRHVERLRTAATASVTHKVPVTKLSTLLEKHALRKIDYCSIDTEGAELAVLADFNPDRFDISVLSIENNYGDGRLFQLMDKLGYEHFAQLEQDSIFRRRGVKRLPRTTVFCAVWHGDPDRQKLLRSHAENLSRQSAPIDSIYVFDGADAPPPWFQGRSICAKDPLTIYQAWNLALAMIETPLAMNLNLDDRLAPNAVETLENALLSTQAAAVGGDWKICYSQADTDNVEPCYPADRLPFVGDWPPAPGTLTRLGSAPGQRNTIGPATLWRVDLHMHLPRFPWRFTDGTLLRTAADSIWWELIQRHLGRKIHQIPAIIGNYHSHPQQQAEFRKLPHDELALLRDPGVSLI